MTAEETREAEAIAEAEHFDAQLHSLLAALGRMEKDPTLAAEGEADQELATWVAHIQDIRKRLSLVEVELATALGKRVGKTVGELSDGRQFQLARATDRKAWDHEEWKRDARRQVVNAFTERVVLHSHDEASLVDTRTGEDLTLGQVLHMAITEVQEVHGSTEPRSRALRALGLYPDNYCTTTPSGWRFTAVKPTEKKDTDTDAE